MRLSYSRRQLHLRSSRRFWPRAMIDQRPRATVGIPMPPEASKLTSIASAPAARASAGMGSRFQSGTSKRAAVSQAPPRISQRGEEICLERDRASRRATTNAQPAPAQSMSQPVRAGGRSSGSRGWWAVVDRGHGRGGGRGGSIDRLRAGSRGRRWRARGSSRTPSPVPPSRQRSARKPAVAQTSRNRLWGSTISSLAVGQHVSQVGAGEIAGADAPPECGPGEGTGERSARLGDHAPGALPVLRAVAERLTGLRQDLRIEPLGGETGEHQGGDDECTGEPDCEEYAARHGARARRASRHRPVATPR